MTDDLARWLAENAGATAVLVAFLGVVYKIVSVRNQHRQERVLKRMEREHEVMLALIERLPKDGE